MQLARPHPRRPLADLYESNSPAIDKPPKLTKRYAKDTRRLRESKQ
jgi:hypothetical protein